jgi:excisionase family DNA binding protein
MVENIEKKDLAQLEKKAYVDDDEVLLLQELMARLRCCESTVRKMIRNGLPCFRVGNEYRFHYRKVISYLEKK